MEVFLVADSSAAGEGKSEHIRDQKSLVHYKLWASDFWFLIFNRNIVFLFDNT